MGQISVTFNGTVTDLGDFCIGAHYRETVPDPSNLGQTIPNPESKKDFLIRKSHEYVWGTVHSHRINKAAKEGGDVERAKTVNF